VTAPAVGAWAAALDPRLVHRLLGRRASVPEPAQRALDRLALPERLVPLSRQLAARARLAAVDEAAAGLPVVRPAPRPDGEPAPLVPPRVRPGTRALRVRPGVRVAHGHVPAATPVPGAADGAGPGGAGAPPMAGRQVAGGTATGGRDADGARPEDLAVPAPHRRPEPVVREDGDAVVSSAPRVPPAEPSPPGRAGTGAGPASPAHSPRPRRRGSAPARLPVVRPRAAARPAPSALPVRSTSPAPPDGPAPRPPAAARQTRVAGLLPPTLPGAAGPGAAARPSATPRAAAAPPAGPAHGGAVQRQPLDAAASGSAACGSPACGPAPDAEPLAQEDLVEQVLRRLDREVAVAVERRGLRPGERRGGLLG
jgi:hypothetical protein